MPEMDGLAATRLIRQRGGALARVPIIALTANAFPEDVKACFDAGMNQFVTKPVSKDVLFAAILRALSPQAAPSARAPDPDRRRHRWCSTPPRCTRWGRISAMTASPK